MEKYYTIKEVSALTGFAEGTLRNKISDGEISIKKIGRNTRITESELKRFMEVDD